MSARNSPTRTAADRAFSCLNLEGCVLGLIVVQPGVDGAVDQKNEADQSDQRRGQFRRQRNAQRPARRRFAGLSRRIKRYVRVRRADCASYGHSITSSASPGSPRDRHANCAGETATDLRNWQGGIGACPIPETSGVGRLVRHSITSSASPSKSMGGSRPIALAVFRLMTKRYRVGVSKGMSPGRVPLKMRSTIEAARVRDSWRSAP